MSLIKIINGANNDKDFIPQIHKYMVDDVKTRKGKLVGASNCFKEHAVKDFMTVKKLYHKTHGRQGIHMVLSITPDILKNSDEVYMEIANRMANYFSKYQSVYAVHKDSKYRHIHMVLNSVSFQNGKKFSQSKQELNQLKGYFNHILEEYNLDIIKTKTDDILDENPYNLDDGFDFLELNDDKPEPRISPLMDASQDELFMAELSGNHIVKSRKTEENKPVFTGSDNESEDIIMNKNNNFEYGNNSINYDNSVPFDIQPVTVPSQYIPPQMYQPQYNFPAPYIPQPVQQDMYYANANMPTNVQQYPMFYPPLPTFFFNNNQNLNVRIPMTMTPDMLNQYISINALTPSDYIDKTKLGMAVMSKFNQQNINANVMIGMDKNIYLDFVDSLNNNEKFGGDVIEVPYNE